MNKETKPEFSKPADFQLLPEWYFHVKSYQINITNMPVDMKINYAAGIFVTDNSGGVTGQRQRHAVLQFYWDAANVLSPGGPDETGLLHLNYTVAEYAGILDLLKGAETLRCYFKPLLNYGGIIQEAPVPR